MLFVFTIGKNVFTHPRGVRSHIASENQQKHGCSNSRTREGCDQRPQRPRGRARSFNSRTREGCDTVCGNNNRKGLTFQFTHPRGVRPSSPCILACGQKFQFTHPRGVRQQNVSAWDEAIFEFQFTHPRGVRRLFRLRGVLELRFQFTHPRGVRPGTVAVNAIRREVSIHAPARGATDASIIPFRAFVRFNSRTREGCDRRSVMNITGIKLFQFTHPRGVRPKLLGIRRARVEFQFTHPRGVRRQNGGGGQPHPLVSIHAPARGATRAR